MNGFSISTRKAWVIFIICILLTLSAYIAAWLVQTDFGKVRVSNVHYLNSNGIPIRAKLLYHKGIDAQNPAPGIVYTHGYQNNRETSDAYCIELARRGFVALCIDAIGRGNSGNPNDINDPTFDPSYGVKSSLQYLRSLPMVDPSRTGLMGHSLGAEMSFGVALEDPTVQALVISGYAYTDKATMTNPKNMLMIFGKYDEYRTRMTGTKDFEKEWMSSPRTQKVISAENPQFGITYGDFAAGTARRVYMPLITHVQESHNRGAIAEALTWMQNALQPDARLWIDVRHQIWEIKEVSTLIAMLACLGSILPLAVILIQVPFFRPLRQEPSPKVVCTAKEYLRHTLINGLLAWLYFPLILILFAVHLYLVRIDKVFPMMLVNGIVWWFVITNLIRFFIWRRWYRRQTSAGKMNLVDAGVSEKPDRLWLSKGTIFRTLLLGVGLFLFVCLLEALLERIWIVDLRFIFPFASDLTPYRILMLLLYFPFLFLGFLQMGNFLYSQVRRGVKDGFGRKFLARSGWGILAVVSPLILMVTCLPTQRM